MRKPSSALAESPRAWRMRDAVSARNLIEEAARLGYGHAAMLRAFRQHHQARSRQCDCRCAEHGYWADKAFPDHAR